jgi:hypothetical protein
VTDSFDPHAAYSLLRADLVTLFKLVITHNKPCDEGDIRAASVILRRWLVEGLLGRMANALGVVPTLWVMDNDHVLEAIKADETIRYFLTGGVKFDGKPVMCIYESSAEPSEFPRLPIQGGLAQVAMSPSEMLRQKRIFYPDTFFSCEDIIKFTANKLGGVHLDFRRDAHFDKLESASNFMSFGGPLEKMGKPPPGGLYFDFEPNGKEILSGTHIEIIAAAASLLSVEFNGNALLEITQKPSFRGRVKKALRMPPRFRANLYEVGLEDEQCS